MRFLLQRSARWMPASCLVLSGLLGACGGGGGGSSSDNGTTTGSEPPTGGTPAPAPAPLPATPPVGVDVTCGLPNFQTELLQRVNEARAAGAVCGGTAHPAAAALRWNTPLQNAAWGHASDMASRDYFSHASQDGRNMGQRLEAAGYGASAAAENIAAGQQTVRDVMASWMSSAGHCANILSANYRDIGVACARHSGSTYGRYWVMNLGSAR
jgi:uncharacterized protein YkwD